MDVSGKVRLLPGRETRPLMLFTRASPGHRQLPMPIDPENKIRERTIDRIILPRVARDPLASGLASDGETTGLVRR